MSLATAIDTSRALRLLAGAGIHTITGVLALLTLREHGESSIGQLARRADCTPANITGSIDRLESAGYVQRLRLRHDRRICHVRLLPDGLSLLQRAGL